MQTRPVIRWLAWCIAAVAALAAGVGIFYRAGPGSYEHLSVRGENVTIYGSGLYRHMSAEVAPQGIAQDVVTLFVAIPLLLFALRLSGNGSIRGRFLLAGTLAYFFVTYLFYLVMGMYNAMFLAYATLASASFFALSAVLLGVDVPALPPMFADRVAATRAGVFLIANAVAIGLLWLGIVVPPLLDGTVIPHQVEHYTTLVVQGLDLSLLLPLSVVSGWLLLKRNPLGFLMAPTYMVFLALLMTALTAKIVAMGMLGYSIIPAIFIIPTLHIVAIVLAVLLLRSIDASGGRPQAALTRTARLR
jgi:hypothetical protein